MSRRIVSISSVVVLSAFALSGCASNSDEAKCGVYWEETGNFLAATVRGEPSARIDYADALKELSNGASQELGAALKADYGQLYTTFDNTPTKTARICGEYLEG